MKNNNHSLTKRAGLIFFSQLLQQTARLIIGFVVTPIVIRGLGAELYGAWTMIQQSVGYLSLSDFRPMGTLKFTLAVRQHVDDPDEKRRQIGSALFTWILTLPLFLTLGGLAIYKLPLFIRVNPEYFKVLQFTIAIMVLSVAMNRVLSLPANVLRGMNLEYKAMGLNALIILFNGCLVALVVWMGWGLPGVAGATVIGLIISGLVRLYVAKGTISWFGISKPKKIEFIDFIKISAWLTFSGLGGLLLTASDLLIVGFLLGPESAAIYFTTGAAIRMTTDPLAQFIGSANIGLAGICGQGDWKRAMKIRTEMFTLGMAGITFLGAGILLLNKSFVGLWVGQKYFGGQVTTLLLILAAISRLFFRIDNILIAGMLEIKRMSVSMFIGGLCVMGLGFWLTSIWGLSGMAIATSVGYLSQLGYYQLIIKERAGLSLKPFFVRLARSFFSVIPIFVFCYIGYFFILLQEWLGFFFIAILISVVLLCYVWFLMLDFHDRNHIILRVKSSTGSVK